MWKEGEANLAQYEEYTTDFFLRSLASNVGPLLFFFLLGGGGGSIIQTSQLTIKQRKNRIGVF